MRAIIGRGMSAALRLVCLCLVCATVAGCGGGSSGGASSSDRQAITQMFKTISSALARADYGAACDRLSTRQQATIVAGTQKAGLSATTCAEAFAALIKATGVSPAQLAQTFGGSTGTPQIHSITVHGDQATVSYTETADGHTFNETDALVRQDGEWKADRIIHRTQVQ
jgi:hypothetical protein